MMEKKDPLGLLSLDVQVRERMIASMIEADLDIEFSTVMNLLRNGEVLVFAEDAFEVASLFTSTQEVVDWVLVGSNSHTPVEALEPGTVRDFLEKEDAVVGEVYILAAGEVRKGFLPLKQGLCIAPGKAWCYEEPPAGTIIMIDWANPHIWLKRASWFRLSHPAAIETPHHVNTLEDLGKEYPHDDLRVEYIPESKS